MLHLFVFVFASLFTELLSLWLTGMSVFVVLWFFVVVVSHLIASSHWALLCFVCVSLYGCFCLFFFFAVILCFCCHVASLCGCFCITLYLFCDSCHKTCAFSFKQQKSLHTETLIALRELNSKTARDLKNTRNISLLLKPLATSSGKGQRSQRRSQWLTRERLGRTTNTRERAKLHTNACVLDIRV